MILFVGDDLSPKAKTPVPFKGAACEKRLNEWIATLGFDRKDVKIINRTDKNFQLAVMLAAHRGLPIVALGNNASSAVTPVPHFKLPHPSGRNRQINNKEFISAKLYECKKWLNRWKSDGL